MRLLRREPKTAEEWAAWQLENEIQSIIQRRHRLGAKTLEEYIALSCIICQERYRPDNPQHLAPNCTHCRHRHWFAEGHYYGRKRQRCQFAPAKINAYGEVVLCDYWEPPVPEEEAEKRRLWKLSKTQWEVEQKRALVR